MPLTAALEAAVMWVQRSARRASKIAQVALCSLALWPATAHAFETKTTASGLPVHWQQPNVTFETDPSVSSMTPSAAAVISSSVQAWSGAAGGPVLSVVAAPSASQPAYDSTNVIYFEPNGYALAGDALAITILTYDDTTGYILDADLVINGVYSFGILPDGAAPAADAPQIANDATEVSGGFSTLAVGMFDIAHVVAHETGHSLGMSDEMTNDKPLMFLYTQPGDASRRAPVADDLAGMEELYADSGSAGGCSSSTVSPKHARASMVVMIGTLLVFGIALLRMRRAAAWRSGMIAGALVVGVGVGPARALVAQQAQAPASSVLPHAGDARARVVGLRAVETEGPWRTEVSLSTVECHLAPCAESTTLTVWGGRRGNLVQEVGDVAPPAVGDELEVQAGDDGVRRVVHRK